MHNTQRTIKYDEPFDYVIIQTKINNHLIEYWYHVNRVHAILRPHFKTLLPDWSEHGQIAIAMNITDCLNTNADLVIELLLHCVRTDDIIVKHLN